MKNLYKIIAILAAAATLVPMLHLMLMAPPAQAAGPTAAQTTIEYWDPDDRAGHHEARAEFIADFEKAHPDIKVNLTIVPWDQMNAKLEAALATNTLPDVFMSWDGLPLSYYQQGMIVPLNDVVDQIGKDDFYPKELAMVTYEDKILAIPHTNVVHLLWYRKDWFDAAGIKPPTTWDEWLAAAKAFNAPDKKVYGQLCYAQYPEYYMLSNLMMSVGAGTFDKDNKIIINSPETIEAMKFLGQLGEYCQPGFVATTQTQQRLAFVAGGGAMLMSSSSFLNELMSTAPDKIALFGVVPIPRKNPATPWTGFTDGVYLSLTKSAKPEAKVFLQDFYKPDNYLKYAQGTVIGWLPILKSVRENPAYLSVPRLQPVADIIKGAFPALESPMMTGQELGPNKWVGFINGEEIFMKMISKLLVDKEKPEDIAAWAEQQVQTIVDENP